MSSVVPGGFVSYARILHAPRALNREWTWREVAKLGSRELKPETQWAEVARAAGSTVPEVIRAAPAIGSLLPKEFSRLAEIALSQTVSDVIYCAYWTGFGFLPSDGVPVFDGHYREYALYEVPASRLIAAIDSQVGGYQSPSLWWPADQSWCVSSEIDLESTYVAGSRPLIQELTRSELEVLEAGPNVRVNALP